MTNLVDDVAIAEIAEFVHVTPHIAQRWLGLNTGNRKLKQNAIMAFSRDMAEGRWRTNGEAIKLAGPPLAPTKLLDGQNRLHALIKSGVEELRLLVVFGVDEDAQQTMDSGNKRTVADNLTIAGLPNAHITAAAARLALAIDDLSLAKGAATATNARQMEFIADNFDSLARAASVASMYAHRADAPASVIAYTHWRLAQLDLNDATAFWRDVAEKIDLPKGDPALALAGRLAQARRNRERTNQAAVAAAVFRAWNARRTGQTLRTVAFTAVGAAGLPKVR